MDRLLEAIQTTTDKTIARPIVGDIAELAASWSGDLITASLSLRTIQSYLESVRLLTEYLQAAGMPMTVAHITHGHVEPFIEDQLARWKPATAEVRYASLRVFFGWLVDNGGIKDSPMARMRKSKQPERLTEIPSTDDLKRFLADMNGDSFDDLRNRAIVRLFISTGARLGEVSELRYDMAEPTANDLDLDARTVRLIGKGDREHLDSLEPKAVKALDRYLRRARRQHAASDTPWPWLGRKGRLTASGICQMVRDRGERLGIKLHPHAFRHRYADTLLANGM